MYCNTCVLLREDIASLLLQYGADPNSPDIQGDCALEYAAAALWPGNLGDNLVIYSYLLILLINSNIIKLLYG